VEKMDDGIILSMMIGKRENCPECPPSPST